MSLFKRSVLLLAFVFVAVTTSGCLRRTIVDIEDHPARNVTILRTVDQFPLGFSTQFWQCIDEPEQLVCSKTCGGRNQPECHTIALGGYINNLK